LSGMVRSKGASPASPPPLIGACLEELPMVENGKIHGFDYPHASYKAVRKRPKRRRAVVESIRRLDIERLEPGVA